MSIAKSTKWGNSSISGMVAHKEYICQKATRQYWSGIKPTNFKKQWETLLKSSLNYERSKRVDYRFVFSVSKNKSINQKKLYACGIQFWRQHFNDWVGLFALHGTENQYHFHFLLNPVNVNHPNRKFHKISPADYEKIKQGWDDYLKIFGLWDGIYNNKYKQRSWGKYYHDRKNGNSKKYQRFQNYNLKTRELFIHNFFNPFLFKFNKRYDFQFKQLEKKKYRKNNKYKYYQTKDLIVVIKQLKDKWSIIKWKIAINKLNSNSLIKAFENLFSLEQNGKLSKSFPSIWNDFQNNDLNYLFSDAHDLSDNFQYIKSILDDEFENSLSR